MSSSDILTERIAEMPLLDHHCHAPLRLPQQIDGPTLRAPFTESDLRVVQAEDVPQTTGYRAMIRWLAQLLAVEPTEAAVLEARAGFEPEQYHRLLADDARLGPLFCDHLFAEGHSISPERWADLTGRRVQKVLRIESFAEKLLPSASCWESFQHEFTSSLAAARSHGVVAFKSIAAYRSGLAVEHVDAATVTAAFETVCDAIEAGQFDRLTSKPLIDALIWETLEVAAELGMPVQFHVGLGDDDVFLPDSNPVHLRLIFQESRLRGVPIVLLHCYPYVREAAYLSSIYPNAYTDLGLTVPLAGSHCPELIAEAIGLAPATKVLASTDGHGAPEFQWFAAHMWRRGLSQALADAVNVDMLDVREAAEVAALVLHRNSERIYPV